MSINLILPLSNELLFSWLKNASDQCITGAIIIDMTKAELLIIYYNQTFATISNYNNEQLIGHNISILNGAKTNSEIAVQLHNHLKHGIPSKVTLLQYGLHDTTFWNQLTIQPIRNLNGELVYTFLLCEDYTNKILDKSLSTLEREVYAQLEHETSTASMLQLIATRVEDIFIQPTKCAINLLDESGDYHLMTASSLSPFIVGECTVIQFNQMLAEHTQAIYFQQHESLLVTESHFVPLYSWTMPIMSSQQKGLGAISLFFETKTTLTQCEIQFIERLMKLIALSIRYAKQKEQLH